MLNLHTLFISLICAFAFLKHLPVTDYVWRNAKGAYHYTFINQTEKMLDIIVNILFTLYIVYCDEPISFLCFPIINIAMSFISLAIRKVAKRRIKNYGLLLDEFDGNTVL